MIAGQLRHQVELHSLSVSQDSYGQPTKSWTKYATTYAAVEPIRGAEVERAKQIFAQAEYKVTIRYRAGVKVTDKIVFGSQTFEIGSIINWAQRNIKLEIYCKEVV